MEIAVGNFMNWRTNLIVPNVSWGMFQHECDLIRISRLGYCTEIEIKVSKSDLIKDKQKYHGHCDKKINYLYFAIPDYLIDHIEHIPERAGIIIVTQKVVMLRGKYSHKCKVLRSPKKWNDYKFSDGEIKKLLELMAMRIWNLKTKLAKKVS